MPDVTLADEEGKSMLVDGVRKAFFGKDKREPKFGQDFEAFFVRFEAENWVTF